MCNSAMAKLDGLSLKGNGLMARSERYATTKGDDLMARGNN